jgi:hypothetical protein
MLLREDSSEPVPERVNALTDRFPGLLVPLRADAGVWELDGDAYRRVDETTGEWPSLLAFLAEAAQRLHRSVDEDTPKS